MALYDVTRFRTTHNSYSGGDRGSLVAQLEGKVRCVELDFHDNGYDDLGDFRVGHLKPGMEVALGNGNPNTLLLRAWLDVIAGWSAGHQGHAPITLVFDIKDDLTDNDDGGDLEDLNRTVEAAFGAKIFTRDQYDRTGQWPDLDVVRDKIICVLSGDGSTRAAYRWAFGSTPAIAANTNGDVILAYRSTAGDLNCWTAQADAQTGAVRWRRKATYGLSNLGLAEPAIAINDDGWVVAVDRFGPPPNFPGPRLESRVGRLQDEGRITWFSSATFAAGIAPSLTIDGDDVREIHTMPDGRRRQQVRGTVNRQKRKVEWQGARQTQAVPFPRDMVDWQGHTLGCEAMATGAIGCRFDQGAVQPARFRQIAFVELQKGEDPGTLSDARFFAADAKDKAAIARARNQGLVARAWGFADGDETSPPSPPQENMPATDTPGEVWYDTYMSGSAS